MQECPKALATDQKMHVLRPERQVFKDFGGHNEIHQCSYVGTQDISPIFSDNVIT